MASTTQNHPATTTLPSPVKLESGPGGIPLIHVDNNNASAQISLLGGTVLSYKPHATQPVVWMSSQNKFELGTGIRGGIPVCWPWFAVHPQTNYPHHGFVKGMLWEVLKTHEEDNTTHIELGIANISQYSQYWAHNCSLHLSISIGEQLDLCLTTTNGGAHPFIYSAAFHTYFNISHINNTRILGLENIPYQCKMRNNQQFVDTDALKINEPVNRIYLNPPPICYIEDDGYQRRIVVKKYGNHTTVVWSPSEEWCKNQTDILSSERFSMVCVESVVGPHELQAIQPGQSHTFSTSLTVEKL